MFPDLLANVYNVKAKLFSDKLLVSKLHFSKLFCRFAFHMDHLTPRNKSLLKHNSFWMTNGNQEASGRRNLTSYLPFLYIHDKSDCVRELCARQSAKFISLSLNLMIGYSISLISEIAAVVYVDPDQRTHRSLGFPAEINQKTRSQA